MRKGIVIWVWICTVKTCWAQWQFDQSNLWETGIETLNIQSNNLNELNEEELSTFNFFSSRDIDTIIAYRKAFGPFQSWIELQQCGIPIAQIRRIQEDLELSSHQDWRAYQSLKGKDAWIPTCLTSVSLKNDPIYPGLTYTGKTKFSINHLAQLSVLFHNDASERAMDHISIALELRKTRWLDQLIIGKHALYLGQGMTQNAPFRVGRSLDLGTWVHDEVQLRSIVSQNEDVGSWGLGMTKDVKGWKVITSLGQQRWDTRLNENERIALSRITGGSHKTELELSRRKNNEIKHATVCATRPFRFGTLLFSSSVQSFELPIQNQDKYTHQHEIQWSHEWKNNRLLLNGSIDNHINPSYYLAFVQSWGRYIDFAFKTQSINTGFYAPMKSPYESQGQGIKSMEWGMDGEWGYQLRWKIRKHLEYFRSTAILEDYYRSRWTLYSVLNFSKWTSIASQLRWNNEDPPLIRLSINHKNQRNGELKVEYQTENSGNEHNRLVLLKWKQRWNNGILSFWIFDHNTKRVLYNVLPSSEFAWQLGVFSGQGWGLGTAIRWRISQKWRLKISAQYANKEDARQNGPIIPRIFVTVQTKT